MEAKRVYYFRNAERPEVLYAMLSASDLTSLPMNVAYRSFSDGRDWEIYPGDVWALFNDWAQDPFF